MADPVFVDGVTPINAVNMNKLQTRDEKGAVNGYAPLGADGKVPSAQLPAPVASGANLTYQGDWLNGTTYVDGDVVVSGGVAYLCVGGPTVVPPDSNLWDDSAAPIITTPWVPMWALTPAGGLITGEVKLYAGDVAPAGFLFCDGASYVRSTYGALFSVIGTKYGTADATHFNVPDVQGRTVVGRGTHADVATLGNSDGISAVASRRPKHKHTVNEVAHNHSYTAGGGASAGNPGGGVTAGSTASTTGGKTTGTHQLARKAAPSRQTAPRTSSSTT